MLEKAFVLAIDYIPPALPDDIIKYVIQKINTSKWGRCVLEKVSR